MQPAIFSSRCIHILQKKWREHVVKTLLELEEIVKQLGISQESFDEWLQANRLEREPKKPEELIGLDLSMDSLTHAEGLMFY